MSYDVSWVIPRIRQLNKYVAWRAASNLIIAVVANTSKFYIGCLNRPQIIDVHYLYNAMWNRSPTTPLITLSNHSSVIDDPGFLAILEWKSFLCGSKLRWALAGHNIVFKNLFSSYFFMLGNCMPVVRGNGVYQEAVNYAIELLAEGKWVHVFPEGKVNLTREEMRLKWGIGRMIWDCPVEPIIIPMWHLGMENVIGNSRPYYPGFGKKITFKIGKPIAIGDCVNKLRNCNASDELARKTITDYLQKELYRLRDETIPLHENYVSS